MCRHKRYKAQLLFIQARNDYLRLLVQYEPDVVADFVFRIGYPAGEGKSEIRSDIISAAAVLLLYFAVPILTDMVSIPQAEAVYHVRVACCHNRTYDVGRSVHETYQPAADKTLQIQRRSGHRRDTHRTYASGHAC